VSADEADRVVSFLVAQTDRLLRQRAEAEGQHEARQTHRLFRRRWGGSLPPDAAVPPGAADPGLRALVVDDVFPDAARDAGSRAILSHIRALRSLGYAVSFVAADDFGRGGAPVAALEAEGVVCCRAPVYGSVEDVMRRQARCFDAIYLHRVSNASRYLALARRYFPRARILYSVADLHHVRVARQASAEGRPELVAESQRLRMAECMAAWSADAVLTHSEWEGAALRQAVPSANVHVTPWEVAPRPTATPFLSRNGVAFVGSFGHAPNIDAALFLVDEIMPLVWRRDPSIECVLVGSDMPESIRRLAGPGVRAVGAVVDLAEVFEQVRLTVAPLRYGAGIKGKVLESMAAGVPCAMSPVAAEGIVWPEPLRAVVGENAAALAEQIVRLHGDPAAWADTAETGVSFIRERFDAASVMAALRTAIEGSKPLMVAAQ
jgi:glycosyltransferase involved in cell wall biosynthesis